MNESRFENLGPSSEKNTKKEYLQPEIIILQPAEKFLNTTLPNNIAQSQHSFQNAVPVLNKTKSFWLTTIDISKSILRHISNKDELLEVFTEIKKIGFKNYVKSKIFKRLSTSLEETKSNVNLVYKESKIKDLPKTYYTVELDAKFEYLLCSITELDPDFELIVQNRPIKPFMHNLIAIFTPTIYPKGNEISDITQNLNPSLGMLHKENGVWPNCQLSEVFDYQINYKGRGLVGLDRDGRIVDIYSLDKDLEEILHNLPDNVTSVYQIITLLNRDNLNTSLDINIPYAFEPSVSIPRGGYLRFTRADGTYKNFYFYDESSSGLANVASTIEQFFNTQNSQNEFTSWKFGCFELYGGFLKFKDDIFNNTNREPWAYSILPMNIEGNYALQGFLVRKT